MFCPLERMLFCGAAVLPVKNWLLVTEKSSARVPEKICKAFVKVLAPLKYQVPVPAFATVVVLVNEPETALLLMTPTTRLPVVLPSK